MTQVWWLLQQADVHHGAWAPPPCFGGDPGHRGANTPAEYAELTKGRVMVQMLFDLRFCILLGRWAEALKVATQWRLPLLDNHVLAPLWLSQVLQICCGEASSPEASPEVAISSGKTGLC